MNDERREGERLFRAWNETTVPFDEEKGIARFLESAQRKRARPHSNARLVMLVAAVLAATSLIAAAWFFWRAPPKDPSAQSSGEGLLHVWLATDKNEMPIAFAEGSRLVIRPDSRGRVEKVSEDGASFLIERGEVQAHVVHRTHTDWRFLAGPFEVEVTGTVLDVAWDPSGERFSVHVEQGEVVVRGPELGARQIVRTGERCVVDLPTHSMHMSSATDPAVSSSVVPETSTKLEPPLVPSAPVVSPSARPAPTPWTTFEERGDYDGAYGAATAAGLASLYRASTADELLRLAQVAQLSGHRVTERDALLACRRRFPDSEPSAVAAYELGRGASPSEAATWFDTYLREQPSGPLAREALGRLVEAQAAAGDDAGAREAAKRYLARFPEGPHAALARRVLGGAHE